MNKHVAMGGIHGSVVLEGLLEGALISIDQGTIGCTPNSVPMVFIAFSRDSWVL